jgi:hypothetical protein
MGWFKDLFSDEKGDLLKAKYINKLPDGLKWIFVSLIVNFKGIPKKEILKIARDIANIINNTHAMINEKGEYVGYTNPYLKINFAQASTCDNGKINNITNLYSRVPIPKEAQTFFPKDFANKKNVLSSNVSRPFYPLIEKASKDSWKLIFVPEIINKKDKTNLYSIENWARDFWILAGASNLICEKYNIPISEERPTFNPILLTGAPAIELHDHLLVIKYHVHDRIASAIKNPELDKFVLGNGDTIFEVIEKISEDQPKSVWTHMVKKIL